MGMNLTREQKWEEARQAQKVALGFYRAWSLVSHCSACRDTRRLPVGAILRGREDMPMAEVVARLRCQAVSLKGRSCGEPPSSVKLIRDGYEIQLK